MREEMSTKHQDEQDFQSCDFNREQGRELVIRGAKAIREGKNFLADGLKLSAEGFVEFIFWGGSKIFMGIEEGDHKYLK